jgi:hypothetical protein
MKNFHLAVATIACIFTLLTFSFSNSFAQKQNKLPGTGEQAANGCLACTGSEWNDAQNITQNDNQSATTTMTANGSCFQTVCFFSRGLIASNFGFTIPSAAIIKGIRVGVDRNANMPGAVKDSFIQLEKSANLVGLKKKVNVFWPLTPTVRSYGGTTDLWGSNWTPADINDPGFGVFLKCYNTTANSPEASVDYMRVTIFYSGGDGGKEQSVVYDLSGQDLMIYPNPSTGHVTLKLNTQNGNLDVSLFNATGENCDEYS